MIEEDIVFVQFGSINEPLNIVSNIKRIHFNEETRKCVKHVSKSIISIVERVDKFDCKDSLILEHQKVKEVLVVRYLVKLNSIMGYHK